MSGFEEHLCQELEALGPTEGQLSGLLDRLTEVPRRQGRGMPQRAVVALAVCGALIVTALAAGPSIWETLTGRLGPFAPYAAQLEGTATDQGVRAEVVGTVMNGYRAEVYYTLTDLTGGRFNDHTEVHASLEGADLGAGSGGTEVLSCSGDGTLLLVRTEATGLDFSQPAELRIRGIDPSVRRAWVEFPPPSSAEPLETVEADGEQVAAPGQNSARSPETEDFYLSSAGFDQWGRFQALVQFSGPYSDFMFAIPYDADDHPLGEDLVTVEVDGGTYNILTGVDPEAIDYIWVYGTYSGPEEPIQGDWTIPLPLSAEPVARETVAVNRKIGVFPVREMEISPLGVTVFHGPTDDGTLFYGNGDVKVVRTDGAEAALTLNISGQTTSEAREFYSVWSFDEPVELKEISSVSILGEVVWSR